MLTRSIDTGTDTQDESTASLLEVIETFSRTVWPAEPQVNELKALLKVAPFRPKTLTSLKVPPLMMFSKPPEE